MFHQVYKIKANVKRDFLICMCTVRVLVTNVLIISKDKSY